MNRQHLSAFLWLRWRLRINQLRRGGVANAVILAILAALVAVVAAVLFAVFLALGLFTFKDVEPSILMYLLDGTVVAFLFLWIIGLLTELQRTEALSLEKFLHLPVSLSSAFLINYLSSLPSVSLLWFLSAMLGLNLGLFVTRGWAMLLLLPMLFVFVLMITALTYQFQGWLASMMANPRRRRTIIVASTMLIVLLSQLPNLVNVMSTWRSQPRQDLSPSMNQKKEELMRDFTSGKILEEDFPRRWEKINRESQAQDAKEKVKRIFQMERTIRLLNLVLPPGWLAVGGAAAAEHRLSLILLAILGPGLIGTASLWRAYRTTMRLYTGQYTSGRIDGAATRSVGRDGRQSSLMLGADRTPTNRSPSLLERALPGLSEQAAVITLAVFRSLLRAPEAKILLLTPLFMLLTFGSMFLVTTGGVNLPMAIRPLFAFGAMVMVLFSMSGLLGNQFGFDRDGFRVFVLSPARRRDILLGKNLAVAPLALAMGGAAALLVQVVYPMHLENFLALAPRFVSMYLLYCLAANALSILVPMRIAPSSFQPARPGGLAILLQILFMFVCPTVVTLTLLPLGIEWMAETMEWRRGMPLDLLLSLLECAAIVCIYGLLLRLQGDWLQAREQRILQIVTTRMQ